MKIAIVGVGLLGGSFAYRMREQSDAHFFIGIDKSPQHLKKALALGIIDVIAKLDNLQDADLIVLAIPVDEVVKVLPNMLSHILPHQIVIDVSSSKSEIAKAIDQHPNRKNFVSTHPMWGTEYSGPEAAQKNAFTNKVCVICDASKSDTKKMAVVKKIYKQWKMTLVEMNSAEHDLHTAYISHISHITSFALANTVLEKEKDKKKIFELAGSGFQSTVRLAKSSPKMWTPVFQQNKKNVLAVLKEHIHQLQLFETHLKKDDTQKIYDYIVSANAIKKIID